MTRQLIALTLAVGMLMLGMPRSGSAAPQGAGDDQGNWDAVGRLTSGLRILVTTDQGRDINGTLKTASPDVLVIVDKEGRDRALSHDETRTVRVGPRHGGGWYAGLGLLLGVVGGKMAGLGGPPDSLVPIVGPLYGGIIGGAVGYAVGSAINGRPWRVVYERPKGDSSTVSVSPVLSDSQTGVRLTIGF